MVKSLLLYVLFNVAVFNIVYLFLSCCIFLFVMPIKSEHLGIVHIHVNACNKKLNPVINLHLIQHVRFLFKFIGS